MPTTPEFPRSGVRQGGRPGCWRARAARGFTIMEVMMATFVLALGISTSIIAMQSGFKSLDVARDTTLAAQILQSEIERLRMRSWTSINALPASETVDLSTILTSDPALAAKFSKFSLVRTKTADPDRPGDVMDITLRITWNSYDGRAHARSFQTKYMRNGLYDYYYTLAQP